METLEETFPCKRDDPVTAEKAEKEKRIENSRLEIIVFIFPDF